MGPLTQAPPSSRASRLQACALSPSGPRPPTLPVLSPRSGVARPHRPLWGGWWPHPGLGGSAAPCLSCVCPSSLALWAGATNPASTWIVRLGGDAACELGAPCGWEDKPPLNRREAAGLRAVLALGGPSPGDAPSRARPVLGAWGSSTHTRGSERLPRQEDRESLAQALRGLGVRR